ncbi:MAG: hypothetical protein ABIG84_02605 [archaeon]
MQLIISSKICKEGVIEISKTVTGWQISKVKHCGDCDKDGYPYLYQTLEYNGITYRATLGTYLEEIWNTSHNDKKEDSWIQERFNQISNWMNDSETPVRI